MAWLNDFSYTESKKFEVEDGVHAICLKSAIEKTSNKTGARMIEIAYNVKDSNGVQFRTWLVEGEYFDANLSRIMDCFGIDHAQTNPAAWVDRVGKARFDHQGHDKDKDGNERKNVVRIAAYLPKSAAAGTTEEPAAKESAFVAKPITEQHKAPATAIDQVINKDGFPEDIPF